LPDGRRYHHARTTALLITSLTTVSLGLSAGPAAAAEDTGHLDAVRARVDRLSDQADTAQERHQDARATLDGTRTRLGNVTKEIQHQRRLMDSLRAQVASAVLGEYTETGGAAAPARELTTDSKVLLTSVAVVSEDTGSRGDALTAANAQLEQLQQRRVSLRTHVASLAGVEKTLRVREQKVDARLDTLDAKLDDLEAKRIAELGGPAVAYAKAQVGKAYVYGAAGPSAFDCSGLTMAAWSQAGVSLPHSSSAQYSSGPHISESELQPGDLVFYYSPISHVGMYIGNGQIVNALNPGAGVQISGLHDMPYVGAVRPG
jgi:cell wall-associated NlpC family hydrolase